MKLKLTILLLFVTGLGYGQASYTSVGNTRQQKDTIINGVTQKTYKILTGSTPVVYEATRGWVLGQPWARAASASQSGYVSLSDQSLGAGVKIMKGILSDGAVGGYGTGRQDAQIELSNLHTAGHTLLSLYNHVGGGEESAISYGARLSNGTIAQQGAGYIRYVNDDDTFDDYRTVYGFHLPDSYGDKNPFLLFSNNSVHLLSGNTSALPWDTMPDDNTLLISGTMNNTGLSKLGGGLRVSTDNSYTSTTTYSFRDGLGINNPNAFPFTTDTSAVLHIGSMTSGYSANAVGKYLGAGFEILNGNTNHFLKADGGVDSTIYAINSSVVHKTGNETVDGEKTLTDKLILTRVGGQSSLQGTTDLALDGTTLFLNAYTNGDVNINLGGGKVVTNGLDTYGSDLSGSYTSRTKIDKGYADATYATLPTNTVEEDNFNPVSSDGVYSYIKNRESENTTSSNLTLDLSGWYTYTGTTGTWTLPAVSGNTGKTYRIKNRGSGILTINANSGTEVYTSTGVVGVAITAGSSIVLHNDGGFWSVHQ